MQLDEVKARAREKAASLPEPSADEADKLRSELAAFFGRVPEPPVYRRREDPARTQAAELIAQGEELLARLERSDEALKLWREALEAHLEALCFVAGGRVEAAELIWRKALVLEQHASNERRVWARSDEAVLPVFHRESGASRYDPRPEPTVQVKLICPSCHAVNDYEFSPRYATHRFNCKSCKVAFQAYIGELRSLEVDRKERRRHYLFRIDELAGTTTRITFEDTSQGELSAARRDLLAFLYQPANNLRGVLNLSSSRVLWIKTGWSCFVATVAFGEGSPELHAFRAFRDRVLVPHAHWAVDAYYAYGPAVARWLSRRPLARAFTRRGLGLVHRALVRSGF